PPENDDHIGLLRCGLKRKFADSLGAALGTAIFEREIPALDIAEIAQTPDEGGQVGIGSGRTEEKHAKPRDLTGRLCLGDKRYKCKAEHKNEPDPAHGHLGEDGWQGV